MSQSREIYGFDHETKIAVREKYGTCPLCGNSKKLTVHHCFVEVHEAAACKIDRSLVTSEDNAILLCDDCHQKLNLQTQDSDLDAHKVEYNKHVLTESRQQKETQQSAYQDKHWREIPPWQWR